MGKLSLSLSPRVFPCSSTTNIHPYSPHTYLWGPFCVLQRAYHQCVSRGSLVVQAPHGGDPAAFGLHREQLGVAVYHHVGNLREKKRRVVKREMWSCALRREGR